MIRTTGYWRRNSFQLFSLEQLPCELMKGNVDEEDFDSGGLVPMAIWAKPIDPGGARCVQTALDPRGTDWHLVRVREEMAHSRWPLARDCPREYGDSRISRSTWPRSALPACVCMPLGKLERSPASEWAVWTRQVTGHRERHGAAPVERAMEIHLSGRGWSIAFGRLPQGRLR